MPYCAALKNHMCVTVSESWRPCCRFNNFPHVNIHDVSFFEYKQSNFYKNIITDMEADWATGCSKCKSEEDRGHTSLRQVLNSELSGSDSLEYIELSMSNDCNLACKMCSPAYSTLWNKMVSKSEVLQQYHKSVTQPQITVENIFKNVDITKLKKIKYLGGEPFITPQIGILFKYLEDNNVIQNIEFECNTNCTLFPSKWLGVMSKFKKLNIELSIDGVGPLNDYIRYGKSWDTIYETIKKWIDCKKSLENLFLSVYTTVQAYNLHDIKNIRALAVENNMNFYSSLLIVPEFLSINVLPEQYLTKIKDEYNQKYYKSIKPTPELFKQFVKYTTDVDNETGFYIKGVVPALYKYMDGETNEF